MRFRGVLGAGVLVAFSSLTSAHLFLRTPTPVDPIKDPLGATYAFPCHGKTVPSTGAVSMAAGSSQQLIFENVDSSLPYGNSAVHGGGSCQLSLSYETDATKLMDPTNWHVIYSIIGGCPTNSQYNLDTQYAANFKGPKGIYTGSWQCTNETTNGVDCINSFNFTIPAGVKNGNAILAWTWFNNLGNREMYMNCAPVSITGGTGSEMSSFPALFVANLADAKYGTHASCPTTQSTNVVFPFPGAYVTTYTPTPRSGAATPVFEYPYATPAGAGCAGDGSVAGVATAPANASAAGTGKSSAATSAAATTAGVNAANAASTGGGGGATVTVVQAVLVSACADPNVIYTQSGGGSSAAESTTTTTTPPVAAGSSAAGSSAAGSTTVVAAGAAQSTTTTAASSAAAASGGKPQFTGAVRRSQDPELCAAGQVPCSSDGAEIVCDGSQNYYICSGGCGTVFELAEGTVCDATVKPNRIVAAQHGQHNGQDLKRSAYNPYRPGSDSSGSGSEKRGPGVKERTGTLADRGSVPKHNPHPPFGKRTLRDRKVRRTNFWW